MNGLPKRAHLDESDVSFIKRSNLSPDVIASLVGCSRGTVNYYKNRGIWSKRKSNKR